MRYLIITLGILSGCGSKVDPFKPVPECVGAQVMPFMGDRQLVLSSLALADANEGFDLDLDGKKDNKLAALGSIANPQIADSFTKKHDLILPVELYGYTGEANTSCTKFAFYIGRFNQDRDADGADTTWDTNDDGTAKGDCMDTDNTIGPGVTEVPGNRVDDDCDGFADNTSRGHAGTDSMDLDGDGFSPAQGDCDDRNDTPDHLALAKTRHPGAMDICDNGIDENCDGIPDNDPTCDPFMQNDLSFFVLQSSFDANMQPLIQFKDGKVKNSVLSAGPDLFSLSIPIQSTNIELELSGARVQMTLADDGTHTNIMNGLLGGVLEAVSLEQISGINASGVIKPDQSLLDAIFVGAAGAVLGLDSDKDGHTLPDIDVDGDGLETFWQENPVPGQSAKVNICKDGDGTIVRDNFDGMGTSCALAKDAKGNYRFVDGLSVAITFTAVPGKLGMVVPK